MIFGERLNAYQWTGVALALVSLFLLSRSSRREGVVFTHNLWILFIALAAVTAPSAGCTTNISWRASTRFSCRAGITSTSSG